VKGTAETFYVVLRFPHPVGLQLQGRKEEGERRKGRRKERERKKGDNVPDDSKRKGLMIECITR